MSPPGRPKGDIRCAKHEDAPASDCVEISLRPATPADALCLGVLGLQVFLDTYATEGIRAAVAREALASFSTEAVTAAMTLPTKRFLLAERGDHLVGFAELSIGASHPLVPEARPAELERLYVQEGFTGRGLGSRLLAASETLVQAEGASLLWLTAWARNQRALGFYLARAYLDRGETWFHTQGEQHANRLFAKPLGPIDTA